jgi:hypothetical protein
MKVIANQDLFTGLNIFTIFDTNNNPVLERLYFNYNGLNIKISELEKVNATTDSITVSLPFSNNESEKINSFSVSVLPKDTNSFSHQNIISQLFLQPYIKGYIEQARYYFTEITPKKQFELDNLLITQGWSSYDWDAIFNTPPEYDYDYENGISFTINSNGKTNKQYMIYPTLNQSTTFINLTKENASYTAAGLFPVEDESIRIREISTGNVKKPNLYVQFDPIKIPNVDSNIRPLDIYPFLGKPPYFDKSSLDIIKEIEKLDEVIINKKKDYTSIEKLQNRSLGRVEAIDEALIKRYRTLIRYLRDKGFTVADTPTKFEIYTNSVNSTRHRSAINTLETDAITLEAYDPNGQALHLRDNPEVDEHASFDQESSTIPIVYLDGIILQQDLTLLRNLTMDQIEYVEVNKSGAGGGMRSGGAGLIRIKTRPSANINAGAKEVYDSFEIPLKFSVAKKFYIPEYKSYDTDFFKEFGVIDWIPNLNLNKDGNLEFKISNKKLNEFKIVVEGVFSNGFISEVKTIKLN